MLLLLLDCLKKIVDGCMEMEHAKMMASSSAGYTPCGPGSLASNVIPSVLMAADPAFGGLSL